MTQSGQGQEPHPPAARPAHEGVVLPAEGGGETWGAPAAGPTGGRPWDQPWGPAGSGPGTSAGQPEPYPGQPYQGQAYPAQPYPEQQDQGGQAYQGQTYPGQQPYPGQAGQGAAPPQQPGAYPQGGYAPVAQPLPPEAVPGDADATQYIPPVAAGAGPMPVPGERPEESTRFLGTGPLPSPQQSPAVSDADATQYIAPVPAQPSGAPYGIRPGSPDERQPPAEFDSLFRDDSGSTQQMPRLDAGAPQPAARHQAPPRQAHHQYQQPVAPQPSYEEPVRRRSSKVPVIAAVVVGCAVLGLGAGALLSGGGDEPEGGTDKTSVAAATSPASSGAPQPAADPARAQAEALDKLLADSNNSRDAVIRSVENIKKCQNLDQAAGDLRGAAEQRRGLVTRLQGLSIDKLPEHAALSAALTRAWQASASADDHYAAWGDQVKGKKGCKDGKARSTPRFAQGNEASGEATAAKQEAAGLWNGIAGKYGLTTRQPAQL
ncbi:hypothetical protein [Streptomyces sp. SP18CS02]|uniref:hypothetical protein n=1 Tax=Streptomyces sp. SP18CS02 TaxID=3002531 RepID=UPI002E79604C|nr:hypothetical protein [Streptomyces sp. SP18CS02]MEE1755749.1 hypothetical protein [Streptomyces sp. SP18CS02]